MPQSNIEPQEDNEGMLHPELLYGDFSRILKLYNALAVRITRTLDIELLVKVFDDDDAEGDYGWYDVTDLEVPKPTLRSVPN